MPGIASWSAPDLATHVAAVDPHTGYILESREGVANGVATLNSSGYLSDTQSIFLRGSTRTIASGAITLPTARYHSLDTEGAAAIDDLDTIPAGANGQRVLLRQGSASRQIRVKHATGNIWLSGRHDIVLQYNRSNIELVYDTGNGNWSQIGSDADRCGFIDRRTLVSAGFSVAAGATATVTFDTAEETDPRLSYSAGVYTADRIFSVLIDYRGFITGDSSGSGNARIKAFVDLDTGSGYAPVGSIQPAEVGNGEWGHVGCSALITLDVGYKFRIREQESVGTRGISHTTADGSSCVINITEVNV